MTQFTWHGQIERVETSAVPVMHLIASRLADESHLLSDLAMASRDFH